MSGPPAFAHNSTHGIGAGSNVICHIIHIVSNLITVFHGTLLEPLIRCYFLTIDVKVSDSLKCKVKSCRSNVVFCFKFSTNIRFRTVRRICVEKISILAASNSNRISFYCNSIFSIPNAICSTCLLSEKCSCSVSWILKFKVCKNRGFTWVCCKADAI